MSFLNIRRANEAFRALPFWTKLLITLQCMLPGVALWYQLKFIAYEGIKISRMAELIQKMNTLPETSYRPLMSMYGDAIHAGLPGAGSLIMLVWLNIVLAVIGLVIFILLTWKQKP